MKNALLPILLLVLAACLLACTKEPTPVVVPTLALLPSATPTDMPSNTPLPTWTDSPSPTLTPSLTPTPTETFTPSLVPSLTPSETLTPSLTPSHTPTATYTSSNTFTPTETYTPTPTETYTPTDTPTQTLTFTPSDTPTATATFTPYPTVALPSARILSFGASQMFTTPNTTVTLAWVTDGDTTRLDELSEQGGLLMTRTVPASGQITMLMPASGGQKVIFRLSTGRAGRETSQDITITIYCSGGWFFGSQYAPPNAGCPTNPVTSDGRYQTFERGIMIYVSANGFNHIYGMVYDGARYGGAVNGWDGSIMSRIRPPDGLFSPQEMFNWMYFRTSAPNGSWNEALGWAIGNILNAPRTIQWENAMGGSSPFYIDAPDGGVYRFSGGDSGTWGRLR